MAVSVVMKRGKKGIRYLSCTTTVCCIRIHKEYFKSLPYNASGTNVVSTAGLEALGQGHYVKSYDGSCEGCHDMVNGV